MKTLSLDLSLSIPKKKELRGKERLMRFFFIIIIIPVENRNFLPLDSLRTQKNVIPVSDL